MTQETEKSYDDPILVIAEALKQNSTVKILKICQKIGLFFFERFENKKTKKKKKRISRKGSNA